MSDYKIVLKIENYFGLFHVLKEIEKRFTTLSLTEFQEEMEILKKKEELTKQEQKTLEKESDLKINYIYFRFNKKDKKFIIQFMGLKKVFLIQFFIANLENEEFTEDVDILLLNNNFNKLMEYLTKNTKIITTKKERKTKNSLQLAIDNKEKLSIRIGNLKPQILDIGEDKELLKITENYRKDIKLLPIENLINLYSIDYHTKVYWDDILFKRLLKEIRGLSIAFKLEIFPDDDFYIKITEKGYSKSIGEISNEITYYKKDDDVIKGDEYISSFYIMDAFKLFIGGLVLPSSKVKIRIREDYPLRIDVKNNDYGVSFNSFIAPRIESETDSEDWKPIRKQLSLLQFKL